MTIVFWLPCSSFLYFVTAQYGNLPNIIQPHFIWLTNSLKLMLLLQLLLLFLQLLALLLKILMILLLLLLLWLLQWPLLLPFLLQQLLICPYNQKLPLLQHMHHYSIYYSYSFALKFLLLLLPFLFLWCPPLLVSMGGKKRHIWFWFL